MGTLFSKPKDPEEEAAEKLKLLTMNSQNSLLKGLDNFKRGRYLMACSVSGAAFRWAPNEQTGIKPKLGCLKAISFSRLGEWQQCCDAAFLSIDAMNEGAHVNTPLEIILNSTLSNALLNLQKFDEALRCGRSALKMLDRLDQNTDLYCTSVTNSVAELRSGIYLTLTHAHFALHQYDEAAAIAKQGTERYDMPDDVKKKLYGMIARSCVGFERAQQKKKSGEKPASESNLEDKLFCGCGDDE